MSQKSGVTSHRQPKGLVMGSMVASVGRTAVPSLNVPFGIAVADGSVEFFEYEELISALKSLVASVVDRDWFVIIGALSVKVKGYGLRSVLSGV